MAKPDPASFRDLTARDLREVASLSYRQLHDWDSKGAVRSSRAGKRGWRKFTPREAFVLMVCAEIRQQFGVPIDRLAYVREFMLRDGTDHFAAAVDLISFLGTGVWILTDLEGTFIMDSDLEFEQMLSLDFFSGDHPDGYVFVKVNPLVNKLLTCLHEPTLKCHGVGRLIVRSLDTYGDWLDPDERSVLKLLRSGEFDHVEVRAQDGKIRSTKATARKGKATPDEIVSLLEEHDYQSIKVVKRNGLVVSVEQTVPRKSSEAEADAATAGST